MTKTYTLYSIACPRCGVPVKWNQVRWIKDDYGNPNAGKSWIVCKCGHEYSHDSLPEIVEKFYSARESIHKMKDFVEVVLGEPWIEEIRREQ
ncbi:MAG: hypothetical protein CVV44_04170 [Spirochaetae bacterium HGW-Spirochaetae-1]|jgi:hypothetical protein|nr:MAG: hypothetical protein CVV44_04170 [Spirochaetae bacterium HGW-Spirochaetae-1]